MGILTQVGLDLNAFTFQFADGLLDEIRDSYRQHLHSHLLSPSNRHLLEGGRDFRQPIEDSGGDSEYFLLSYGTYPLLWLSNNSHQTYQIYKRFFDGLGIQGDVKNLIDYDKNIIMYCGFLVIGDHAPDTAWHVDYFPGANAYTLITPLFEVIPGHGNLLYEGSNHQVKTYAYKLNEAVIFGEQFTHSTEIYARTNQLRVLVSLTFGTDKLEYWSELKKTIGDQSNYMMLPCGHRNGTCRCLNELSP